VNRAKSVALRQVSAARQKIIAEAKKQGKAIVQIARKEAQKLRKEGERMRRKAEREATRAAKAARAAREQAISIGLATGKWAKGIFDKVWAKGEKMKLLAEAAAMALKHADLVKLLFATANSLTKNKGAELAGPFKTITADLKQWMGEQPSTGRQLLSSDKKKNDGRVSTNPMDAVSRIVKGDSNAKLLDIKAKDSGFWALYVAAAVDAAVVGGGEASHGVILPLSCRDACQGQAIPSATVGYKIGVSAGGSVQLVLSVQMREATYPAKKKVASRSSYTTVGAEAAAGYGGALSVQFDDDGLAGFTVQVPTTGAEISLGAALGYQYNFNPQTYAAGTGRGEPQETRD
jgi:hypothetical protein